MAEASAKIEPDRPREVLSSRRNLTTLNTVAACLVIAATSWFLLKELAGLLRPLLLAVFLCYVLLPAHYFLKRWLPSLLSVIVLAAATGGLFYLFAMMVYGSAVQLHEALPGLIGRGREMVQHANQLWSEHAPPWLANLHADIAAKPDQTARLRDAVAALANGVAATLSDCVVVAFYLLFLLLEAGRFPERVRRAYPEDRAGHILKVVSRINAAVGAYLRVKIQASLLLAIPVTVVLWAFGVNFALMWGVLTFVANFIPYVGSLVACTLPVLLAFLQLDPGWRPVAVGVLLITFHTTSGNVIEPAMTGRTVGLSSLVILISLAFWGICWGVIGMLLAVPLTVMMKIVLENVEVSRPLARLLEE
jgi:AI-2 transport protein TqsA